MPAIPEDMQKMRDAAAKFLEAANNEDFVVVGVLFRKDGSTISLQNTNDDLVELMRAATDMLAAKMKTGKAIRDRVRRLN
jgi:hypothetical protein